MVFAAGLVIDNPALPSDIRNLLTDRFETFSSIGTDTSTYDRLVDPGQRAERSVD